MLFDDPGDKPFIEFQGAAHVRLLKCRDNNQIGVIYLVDKYFRDYAEKSFFYPALFLQSYQLNGEQRGSFGLGKKMIDLGKNLVGSLNVGETAIAFGNEDG